MVSPAAASRLLMMSITGMDVHKECPHQNNNSTDTYVRFLQEFHSSGRGQAEDGAEVELPDTAGQETPHHVQTGTGGKM